ncbi:MAG: hypothetical protein PHV59_05855 [Victivallales bacterium]|nr:hypothetical protein [Victivallales bacterium]
MGNYKAADNLLDNVFNDQNFNKDVQKKVKETKLIHELVKQRIKSGKSQADIAKMWGCNISTVSRFENKKDKDVKLGELVNYCHAIGSGLGISIAHPLCNSAETLTYYVKQIDDLLTKLSSLAKEYNDDKKIVNGITQFQANILLKIMSHASKHTDDIVERIDLVKPASKTIRIENECGLIEV